MGQVYTVSINQEIYIPQLENHVPCPMKCRMNGVNMNKLTKFLSDNPGEATNALQVIDPLYDDYTPKITFHIQLIETNFPVRKPMVQETQRGLVVRAKYFGISSCSWSPVQDRGFESLRNFSEG